MKRLWLALIFLLWAAPAYADGDTFNRPDNVDLGASWSPIPGRPNLQIFNNQVITSGQLSAGEEYYAPVTGTDQNTSITVTSLTGSDIGDVAALTRVDIAARTYYACIAGKNPSTTTLQERIAGSASVISSDSTVWVAGDILRLDSTGTTQTCYRNGSSLLTGSGTGIASGRPGIRVREDGPTLTDSALDDFITSLSSVAAGAARRVVIFQ